MSASSLARSPTQQGVIQRPTAAHLRSNILNGHVKVASSTNTTGGQPALYSIVGGTITSNYKVALPDITTDDTFATLNTNNNWTGLHTFQQGLTAVGPIVANSSISAGSISGAALTTSGNASVGGNTSVVGTHTVNGQILANGGMTLKTGGTDSGLFTISLGLTFGVVFGAGKVAFHNATPAGQLTGGALSAALPYDATTQAMINTMWGCLRTNGFLS